MRKTIRKTINCILFVGLSAAVVFPNLKQSLTVEATKKTTSLDGLSISEIQAQIKNTQNTIDGYDEQIDALLDEQSIVDEKIDDLNSEIINTMTSIGMKEDELAEKEEEIAGKEERLAETQEEIANAEKEYEAARSREEQQYNDMLVRIRYMYENGGSNYIGFFLQGEGLSDVLNRMDYVEKVYEYDRNKLEEFQETKNQVQELWDALVAEQNQLEQDKLSLEEDRKNLEESKAVLEDQRANLNAMLTQKKRESANYDAEIKKAQQEAAVAKQLLKQEQQQLKLLQEEANKPAKTTGTNNETGNATTGTGEGTGPSAAGGADSSNGGNPGEGTAPDNSVPAADPAESGETTTAGGTGTGSTSSGYDSIVDAASGSDTGKQIAKYALQYVGNPYVPGGTSLTNGADCSGFTYRVYSDFGYKLPRTSYEQRSAGTAVDYSSAQPGDIICYDGHVAIYIGGGKIVHASTQKTGIKVGNATYRTILSVRRII